MAAASAARSGSLCGAVGDGSEESECTAREEGDIVRSGDRSNTSCLLKLVTEMEKKVGCLFHQIY
jgi:hypothetical protein